MAVSATLNLTDLLIITTHDSSTLSPTSLLTMTTHDSWQKSFLMDDSLCNTQFADHDNSRFFLAKELTDG